MFRSTRTNLPASGVTGVTVVAVLEVARFSSSMKCPDCVILELYATVTPFLRSGAAFETHPEFFRRITVAGFDGFVIMRVEKQYVAGVVIIALLDAGPVIDGKRKPHFQAHFYGPIECSDDMIDRALELFRENCKRVGVKLVDSTTQPPEPIKVEPLPRLGSYSDPFEDE